MNNWRWHFYHPFAVFQWRQRAARQLWNMGRKDEANELLGITEEGKREYYEKLARKDEIRARRRHTLGGRILNILGL